MTNSLQDSQVQVAVEMWRYNPRKLSTRNIVDELSLALALREDADERVEETIEEMLNGTVEEDRWLQKLTVLRNSSRAVKNNMPSLEERRVTF